MSQSEVTPTRKEVRRRHGIGFQHIKSEKAFVRSAACGAGMLCEALTPS